MWRNKKPDTPQAAEPKTLQTNQPQKPTLSSWEEPTKMSEGAMRQPGATGNGSTSRLGSSLHVKGEISGNEDLYIDGTVEGLIHLEDRKLTVGATAKLTADIFAGEVIVYGSVNGNVQAKDKIEIKKDGYVTGDLSVAQIVIEHGADFKGSIEIEKSVEKEADRKVSPPAA